MSVTDEILMRIKLEITNDPEGVGYAGKTDDEIMVLLNSPQIKQRVVDETLPSPMNRILNGLAKAPNVIESKDIAAAQTVKVV